MRYEAPSYPAAYHSFEEALEAGQVSDGRVYAKQTVSCDPLPVEPTRIMQMYNAIWTELTPPDLDIAFPTTSLRLEDLNFSGGLPFSDQERESIARRTWVSLKTKAFFLSGYGLAYDVGVLPSGHPVVVPELSTFDTGRMEALLSQMSIERQCWSAKSLSYRTGIEGQVWT